jgi:hypothetical protein
MGGDCSQWCEPFISGASTVAEVPQATQLVVELTFQEPVTRGRTWTAANYAIRDAQLAALGTPALRHRPKG